MTNQEQYELMCEKAEKFDTFMNKPERGNPNPEKADLVCYCLTSTFISTLEKEVSNKDLTNNDIHHIISHFMSDVIHAFNLEFHDYQGALVAWQGDMMAEERIRRELWD